MAIYWEGAVPWLSACGDLNLMLSFVFVFLTHLVSYGQDVIVLVPDHHCFINFDIKLLNLDNNFAFIQSLRFWNISLSCANSLIKIVFEQNDF